MLIFLMVIEFIYGFGNLIEIIELSSGANHRPIKSHAHCNLLNEPTNHHISDLLNNIFENFIHLPNVMKQRNLDYISFPLPVFKGGNFLIFAGGVLELMPSLVNIYSVSLGIFLK